MSKSKQLGTAAETAVVNLLREFWPSAERRALKGALDEGDITGVIGVVFEVKGGAAAKTASDGQIEAWLNETVVETENARADVGVLVVQRKGIGYPNAGRWWAVMEIEPANPTFGSSTSVLVHMHLRDACHLLKAWGY